MSALIDDRPSFDPLMVSNENRTIAMVEVRASGSPIMHQWLLPGRSAIWHPWAWPKHSEGSLAVSMFVERDEQVKTWESALQQAEHVVAWIHYLYDDPDDDDLDDDD